MDLIAARCLVRFGPHPSDMLATASSVIEDDAVASGLELCWTVFPLDIIHFDRVKSFSARTPKTQNFY